MHNAMKRNDSTGEEAKNQAQEDSSSVLNGDKADQRRDDKIHSQIRQNGPPNFIILLEKNRLIPG